MSARDYPEHLVQTTTVSEKDSEWLKNIDPPRLRKPTPVPDEQMPAIFI